MKDQLISVTLGSARFGGNGDELCGTLGKLLAWVQDAISRHGEGAHFALLSDVDSPYVDYRVTRDATPEEVEAYRLHLEKIKDDCRAQRRAEYLRMKAEFEP